MKLHCIVLNWNDAASTIECIGSLLNNGADLSDILVIDNASSDGSPQAIRRTFPEATVVCTSSNRGFAGGMNHGAATLMEDCSKSDAILFLNNDALVLSNVSGLLAALGRSDVGLVSPKIVHRTDRDHVQFEGSTYDWNQASVIWYDSSMSRDREVGGIIDSPRIIGTALAARIDVLMKIGLFDESLFMYFEDDDLSVRSLKAGYRNVVVREARVSHTGKSSKNAPPHYYYFMKRNEYIFWRRHLAPPAWRRRVCSLLAEGFFNVAESSADPDRREALIEGIWGAVSGANGPWIKGGVPTWFRALFVTPRVRIVVTSIESMNLGVMMRGRGGPIRKGIQGSSGGAVAAAGERDAR